VSIQDKDHARPVIRQMSPPRRLLFLVELDEFFLGPVRLEALPYRHTRRAARQRTPVRAGWRSGDGAASVSP